MAIPEYQQTATMWLATMHAWKDPITKVEIEKTTDKTVVVIEHDRWSSKRYARRHPRETASDAYFDTWAEARDWLLKKVDREVESAQAILNRKKSHLATVVALKKQTT